MNVESEIANNNMGLKGVTWTNLANTSALVLFGVIFFLQFQNDAHERRTERELMEKSRQRWEDRNDKMMERINDLTGTMNKALIKLEESSQNIKALTKKLPPMDECNPR